jgi:PAS domain S-box-containing protein
MRADQPQFDILVVGDIPEAISLFDRSQFQHEYPCSPNYLEEGHGLEEALAAEIDAVLIEASPASLERLEEILRDDEMRPVIMVADRSDADRVLEARRHGLHRYVLRLEDEALTTELLAEEMIGVCECLTQTPSMDQPVVGQVFRYAHYYNLPQPFFVVGPDRRLRYVNRAGEEFFERLHDRPAKVGERLDTWALEEAPGTFMDHLDRVFAGEAVDLEYTYEALPADQCHRRLWYRPIEGADGSVVAVSIAMENIGRRVEAEMKFERIEEVLWEHFQASPLPMKVVTRDGTIEKCNPAFRDLLGYESVDEIEGTSIHENVHDEDVERCMEGMGRLFAEEASYGRVELRETRADGEVSWVDHIGLLLPDLVGERDERRALVFAVDINRQKEAERRAQQSMRMQALGELAGGVAHDFNNVLSIVSTVGHLLKSQLVAREDDELIDYVERIEGAVDRGTTLTRQLMSFGRGGEADGAGDVNEAVREVSSLLERTLGENIETRMRLADQLPPVRSDGGRLQQVITNLAVNARDAIGEEGTLTIETGRVDLEVDDASAPGPESDLEEYVVLRVSDTGVGMDQETLEHIFDPFFTTKDSSHGTGLGLATVYKIVDDAGGRIQVDSEPGEGTTFELFFPPAEQPVPDYSSSHTDEEPVQSETPKPTDGSGHKVLLLEDEADLRAPYRIYLEREGYEVLEAGSVEEAEREAGDSNGLDALVADVVLPDGSGVDFARELRKSASDLPVVFISGYAPDLFSDQKEEFGGRWEFLAKPVDSDELLSAVNGVVGGASRAAD